VLPKEAINPQLTLEKPDHRGHFGQWWAQNAGVTRIRQNHLQGWGCGSIPDWSLAAILLSDGRNC